MNILLACEESQAVCLAFRNKGHNAFSCDIIDCSGGHPEWHIKGDCIPLLNGDCTFTTCDGTKHTINGKWDMIIAFPPCTHLSVSGARHFERKRADGSQEDAIKFFKTILEADCDKIVVENPVNIIGGEYVKTWFPKYGDMPKCTQRIQPYEHGHPYTKTTCLWEKGVPLLIPTDIVSKPKGGWVNQSITPSGRYGGFNSKFADATTRSKTFAGVAKAMAEQWG